AQREVLRRFAALGGRVVDSSPMYGRAESVVGDLVAELKLGDRLFLATKVWTSGRDAGIAQMEESMRRLRTRKLDLMQVHNLDDNMKAGLGALPDAAARDRIAAAVAR